MTAFKVGDHVWLKDELRWGHVYSATVVVVDEDTGVTLFLPTLPTGFPTRLPPHLFENRVFTAEVDAWRSSLKDAERHAAEAQSLVDSLQKAVARCEKESKCDPT